MVVWHSPSERPELYCGDRLLLIVHECPHAGAPPRHEIVIIEAQETYWTSPDPTYSGYGPTDGEAWAYEREFLAAARREKAI